MLKKTKFTVVTSTLNCATDLLCTIASMRSQERELFQWIVVDGGSTDDTCAVIHANKDVIDLYLPGPDRGIYEAWNKTIPFISGDWVIFLGAGDTLYTSSTLRLIEKEIENVSEAKIIYGGVYFQNKNGEIIDFQGEVYLRGWRECSPILPCHQGVLHHRSCFETGLKFDTSYKICADAKFMLECSKRSEFKYINLIISNMKRVGISSQWKYWDSLYFEKLRLNKELFFKMPFSQFYVFPKVILKVALAVFIKRITRLWWL